MSDKPVLGKIYQGDFAYADSRLRDGIVRDAGRTGLYKYLGIVESRVTVAKIEKYGSGPDIPTRVPLDEVDVSPLPLGYATIDDEAVFIYRNPIRQYRQATTTRGLIYNGLNSRFRGGGKIGGKGFLSVLYQPVFKDYPPYTEALVMIEDLYTSVAVNRNVAICDQHKVYHRGSVVGGINPQNGLIKLSPKFSFLKESFAGMFDEGYFHGH